VLARQLVLGGTGQGQVAGHLPDAPGGGEADAGAPLGVRLESAAFDLLHLLEQVEVDAGGVVHETRRVRAGHDDDPQLLQLLDGVDRHVARPGHDRSAALDRRASRGEHLLQEEHRSVAGGLGAHEGPTPVGALPGDDTRLVAIGDPLVLPEEEPDLPAPHADVTRGHVGVLPHVAIQLGHEALTEPHDLAVGAPLGVEVAPALAAADGHAGERVLEDLLEPEELDDAQVHRRVEPQAPLVRTEGAVELHAHPPVDLHLAPIVLPGHAEDDLALRFADSLDDLVFGELGVLGNGGTDALQHLAHRLVELDLARVAVDHFVERALQLVIDHETADRATKSLPTARRTGP
jgi:hypothetical protein